VAWGDEADRRERQRRVDAFIATATACHMSDAKWRKLFAILRRLGVGRMAWKLIREDQITWQEPPPEWALMDTCLGDFGLTPAVPYREIDWVEVPAERAAGVAEELAAVGQFPVQQRDTGLRVVGYSW
jgi:hypothetical protein